MTQVEVLIVDDHPDICDMMMRILRHAGYKAACVQAGRHALEFLRNNSVGLVILDVMMPHPNGFEVLRQIREAPHTRSLPVVINTAMFDERVKEHALSRGANEVIQKGEMDIDDWVRTVRRYIPVPTGFNRLKPPQ